MIRSAKLKILPQEQIFLLVGETHLSKQVYLGLGFDCKDRIEDALNTPIDLKVESTYPLASNNNFMIRLLRVAEGAQLNLVVDNG